MAIKLDRELLDRLGLGGLAAHEADVLLASMYKNLERRVGHAVAARMTSAELDAFEEARRVGEGSAQDALARFVPQYRDIVAGEHDAVCAEVAASAPTILHVCGQPTADHDPWRHRRPDPGPALVGAPGGWCHVISPLANVAISIDPRRREVYARFADAALVLRVPDAHHIDPAYVWCDDSGEVRARFADRSDLRWRLPDRPSSGIVDYDKVLSKRRPPLRWTEPPVINERFTHGRWRVTDGPRVEIEDRSDGQTLRLAPLYPGDHWKVVNPHFTPDGSQLVASYNAENVLDSGVHSSSVGYFDAIKQSADRRASEDWPWEFDVRPNQDRRGPFGRDGAHLSLESVGYDPSSTRAAVVDGRRAHLYHLKAWVHLGTLERADQAAVVAPVNIPGAHQLRPVWAGRSVLACDEDGDIWRVDLERYGPPTKLIGATGPGRLVAALRTGDNALLVHSDRTVVGIGGDGEVARYRLDGNGEAVAAAVLVDGRLLLATHEAIELWAGRHLTAAAEVVGSAIAGIASCQWSSEWALAWHEDTTVSTVRAHRRGVHVERESIPHHPGDPFELRASAAVMVDVDRWFLAGPRGGRLNEGRAYVAGPESWIDLEGQSLEYMTGADLVVVRTNEGLDFISADDRSGPRPVCVEAPIHSMATGECGRSVAAASDETLWLIRLLT